VSVRRPAHAPTSRRARLPTDRGSSLPCRPRRTGSAAPRQPGRQDPWPLSPGSCGRRPGGSRPHRGRRASARADGRRRCRRAARREPRVVEVREGRTERSSRRSRRSDHSCCDPPSTRWSRTLRSRWCSARRRATADVGGVAPRPRFARGATEVVEVPADAARLWYSPDVRDRPKQVSGTKARS